ncbi:MAG: 50S ribosomal protein L19e [Candidatus Nanoarchaeia archaeon]
MKLSLQKRLAASILKASPKRVWLDETMLADIKDAITKADVRGLIIEGSIRLKPVTSISKGRQRAIKTQKSKGLRKGKGSQKGKRTARLSQKEAWIGKVRIQRTFLKNLRDKKMIDTSIYRNLYLKSKGGFFRSKRHIKIYLDEQGMMNK